MPQILQQDGTWVRFFDTHFYEIGHEAEATLVKCIDHRYLEVGLNALRYGLGIRTFDMLTRPGPAKILAYEGDDEGELHLKEKLIHDIVLSIKLHHTKKIVLFGHWDCGAYGGSVNFADDIDEEAVAYENDLQLAHSVLRHNFPEAEVLVVYSIKTASDRLEYRQFQAK